MSGGMDLCTWLKRTFPVYDLPVKGPCKQEPNTWHEIRLFISSTFIDTHAERDVIIKRVIPSINRKLSKRFIRITPVDLRWGVLSSESKDCKTIQQTCLSRVEECRDNQYQTPWFLGLRKQRYGWVQDQYSESTEFDEPEQFTWLDELSGTGKNVSITSLECIQAAIPPQVKTVKPTVFFYQRNITNPNDIEANLRWVFDFEHVDKNIYVAADVEKQYIRSPHSGSYGKDRDSLNRYLKNADHITYRNYNCFYEHGSTRITGRNKESGKMFAVGYVSGLEVFEKQLEQDLLEAIEANFEPPKLTDLAPHEIANIPYENFVQDKANTFVGRAQLVESCSSFCGKDSDLEEDTEEEIQRKVVKKISELWTNSGKNNSKNCLKHFMELDQQHITDTNIMIIHGKPGRGKSALFASLSTKCLNEFRPRGHFVFVHAVDSCPGSSSLESMISRLNANLEEYCTGLEKVQGRGKIKKQGGHAGESSHANRVQFLEECARSYPNQLFIVLIDAVNQFKDSLRVYTMWWLPSEESPRNLRVVISTLEEENNTFHNACKVRPKALRVPVDKMLYADGEEMVRKMLSKFNKKLTPDQTSKLLDKNLSPLYLTAATQALRRFGIYEKMDEYIESFPITIPLLFDFFLEIWMKEYGEDFVCLVMCIIALSKDGILENTLNDILDFIEEKDGKDYHCTFGRFYETLNGFLAAGGGGHLRMFHDQLNKVVHKKFLTVEFEPKVHEWLVGFYLHRIEPQLCDAPSVEPPAYYNDCLSQVVYHQQKLISTSPKQLKDVYTLTLRNIYFLGERVKYDQQDALLFEYNSSLRQYQLDIGGSCTGSDGSHIESGAYNEEAQSIDDQPLGQPTKAKYKEEEFVALQQWRKFASCYIPYLKQYWSSVSIHNMVLQQHPDSYVVGDTNKLYKPSGTSSMGWKWENIPTEADDSTMLRYDNDWCLSCAASNYSSNFACVGRGDAVMLYEADSGILLHKIATGGFVVHIHPKSNTFYTGGMCGYLSVWSIDNGYQVWMKLVGKKYSSRFPDVTFIDSVIDAVIWIGDVGEEIGCGTKEGQISLITPGLHEVAKSWNTKCYWNHCYGYNEKSKFMFSAHSKNIQCWKLDGELAETIEFPSGEEVRSMTFHPTFDVAAIGFTASIQILDLQTKEYLMKIRDVKGEVVAYHNSGYWLATLHKDMRTIVMYDTDVNLVNRVHGHEMDVNAMEFIPGTDFLLTAGNDGSKVFSIASSSIGHIDEKWEMRINDHVIGAGVLSNEIEIFVLSYQGVLVVNASSLQYLRRVKIKEWENGFGGAVPHPTKNCVVVFTDWMLLIYDMVSMQLESTIEVMLDYESEINDIVLSPDGHKCIVLIGDSGQALIYEISDTNEKIQEFEKKPLATYKMKGNITSCDINIDNVKVVSSSDTGIDMWDINTGEGIKALFSNTAGVKYAKFIYHPEPRVLYVTSDNWLCTIDMSGCHRKVLNLLPKLLRVLTVTQDERMLVTAGSDMTLTFHDIGTGTVEYTFVDHRSAQFTKGIGLPGNEYLLAYNENSRAYLLKSGVAKEETVSNDYVINCGMLGGNTEYFTISRRGVLQVWDVESLECVRSVNIYGWESTRGGAVVNQAKNSLIIFTKQTLLVVDDITLQTLSSFEDIEGNIEITDVVVSPDGQKCIAVVSEQGRVLVLDISNPNEVKECVKENRVQVVYRTNGKIFSCDIHIDNFHVMTSSDSGIDFWEITTGLVVKSVLQQKCIQFAKFLYEPFVCVIHVDSEGMAALTDMNGKYLKVLPLSTGKNSTIKQPMSLIGKGTVLASGIHVGILNFLNIVDGAMVSQLADQQVDHLSTFLEIPGKKVILAYHGTGKEILPMPAEMIVEANLSHLFINNSNEDFTVACGVLSNKEFYFTLSHQGKFEVISVAESEVVRCVNISVQHDSRFSAYAQPNHENVLVFTKNDTLISVDTGTGRVVELQIWKFGQGPLYADITDFMISPDGNSCVVLVGNQARAFNISSQLKKTCGL